MEPFTEDNLKAAHVHCGWHEKEVRAGSVCGCFYCLTTFPPAEIEDWVHDQPRTALCPRCGIDAVIGDDSGFPVTDPVFLQAMHRYWFERTVSYEEAERIFATARGKRRGGPLKALLVALGLRKLG